MLNALKSIIRRDSCKLSRRCTKRYYRHAVGDTLPGQFRVERVDAIPELDLTFLEARHIPTKAKLIHLEQPADPNRVFAVAFRTLPGDSTGVAHILEHTVLCGSRSFPVRDPFFQMLNRSLSNYMNAWTAADMTVYPFSTVNEQDWRNLRSVYLDAVFQPLLRPLDFRQEAWRVEKRTNDAADTGQYVFKGVVYNEMKGALADGESLFHQLFHQAVLSGSTYSHCSGGDPSSITSLSLVGLKSFYHRFYRPGNAMFYSYGSIDLQEHCQYLSSVLEGQNVESSEKFLEAGPAVFSKASIDHYAPPFTRIIHTLGPVDPTFDESANAGRIAVASIVVPSVQLNFDLGLLSSLLLDGPSSPLHRALLTSGLGKEYAPGTGYDSGSMPVGVFSIGLQGIALDQMDGFHQTVQAILEEALANRNVYFSAERIEALLHGIELSRRDRSASFGMGLLHGLASSWCHRLENLSDTLKLSDRIKALRGSMENAGGATEYFSSLVEQHLLKNPRKLVFTMRPDPKFQETLETEEQERLQTMIESLSTAELDALEVSNQDLRKFQEQQELQKKGQIITTNPLPCLSLEDVPLKGKPSEYQPHLAVPNIFIRQTPSANELCHLNVIVPVESKAEDQSLTTQDLLNFPILCDALTELGVNGWSVEEYELAWRKYTGGLSVTPFMGRRYFGSRPTDPFLSLYISSHGLASNQAKMFEIFGKTLGCSSLGDVGSDLKNRLCSLIQMQASSASNNLASSGTGYAMKFAAASLGSEVGLTKDRLWGVRQVAHLNGLANALQNESKIEEIRNYLYELWERIRFVPFESSRAAILSHSDQVTMDTPQLFKSFMSSAFKPLTLPVQSNNMPKTVEPSTTSSFLRLPINTNFSAKVIQVEEAKVPLAVLSANLKLAARLLRTGFLHPEIREKNGAYGAGAGFSSLTGQFHFYSHRDPNPVGSVAKFDEALKWILLEGVISHQKMLEAKLSLFSSIDAPVDLADEGLDGFKYGISEEERQAFRDAIFAATPTSVRDTIYTHLLKESPQHACIVGGTANPDGQWQVYDGIDEIPL